jgi:hypothetical protein|tara:strand:- start:6783 stop:7145 length:363 start_codon:yes stop_codon:yes gene_type:complete
MSSINLDRSSRLDIRCRKKDTFTLIFTFDQDQSSARPVAGWKMQVRPAADDESNLTVEASGATNFAYSDEGKKLTLTIASTAMTFSGQFVYDIQHASSDSTPVVETFFHGVFTAVEDVTN